MSAQEAREPDVLVGIDIGTSFTKVAYTIRHAGQYGDIRKIQSGSSFGYENNETSSIATILAYQEGARLPDEAPKYFGKQVLQALQHRKDEKLDIYEWFKEDFPGDVTSRMGSDSTDANTNRTANLSPRNLASTDTLILYKEFLSLLYPAIKAEISAELEKNAELPHWMNAHIEFIFSVPATWNRIHETLGRIAAKFKGVVKSAGFGEMDQHKVCIRLTEPEAAAMYYLATMPSELPQEGQTVLVVDSGGGTTDLCLVHIHNTDLGRLGIDRRSAPIGEKLGSIHIDREFKKLAAKRLEELSVQLQASQDWPFAQLSHQMMTHEELFEGYKRSLNPERAAGTEIFTLNGPDLTKYKDLEDGPLVHNHKIKFTYQELAKLFDKIIDGGYVTTNGKEVKVDGINTMIYRARDQIQNDERPSVRDIDMILLAGGLGQSPYLRHKVEKALEESEGLGARIPQVVTMDKPQLCVSQGLIHDRLWNIFSGQKCIANYGILRQTKRRHWNPHHWAASLSNQITRIGNKTFVNDIKWLVKKGNEIPQTPQKYVYSFEHEEKEVVHIVVSEDDKAKPFFNPERDHIAEVICDLGKLTEDSRSNKKYCDVELHFSVGRFDVYCWSGNERKLVGKYRGKFGKAFPGFTFESEG